MKTSKSSSPRKKSSRAATPRKDKTSSRLAKAPLTTSREELLVNWSDRNFRVLVEGLLTFSAIHSAIRDGYSSLLSLTGPRYTILLCIRNLSDDRPVNIRTVADHLRLSGSYITVETKALEQSGLVCKERGADDRRMVSLSLTPKGVALLDSIATLRRQINDVEFGCLSKVEFQLLVPLVERLVQSGERALALQNYLRAHGMHALDENIPGGPVRELA